MAEPSPHLLTSEYRELVEYRFEVAGIVMFAFVDLADPQSISHLVEILTLKPLLPALLPSAHIGEAQEMSPPHSRIEVTGRHLDSNLVMKAQIYFLQVLQTRNSSSQNQFSKEEEVLCYCD